MNTLANKVTVFRIILVSIFMALLYTCPPVTSFIVYVIACLSDCVDGYIARKYNQTSSFGKFMDPIADKILVISLMCFFIEIQRMSGIILAIVCLREFTISGLRMVAADQNIVIAAAKSGKIKTLVTMIGLGAMLIINNHYCDIIVSVLILLTTIYSGVEYFIKNKTVFREGK